jgi:hypothetical protein
VHRADLDAFRRGLLRWEDGYVTTEVADGLPKEPLAGYVLRTDHLILRTNVAFARARQLARLAEVHADRILAALGEPLDLRFPQDPIPIVVCAKCPEFENLLATRVPHGVDWNAFYLAADGTVYACDERPAEGGLSVEADLRHELTHAILDLGRPEAGRRFMFERPQFWVWEGIATWSESLGDPPCARAGAERISRFQRRLAWGDRVSLRALSLLPQAEFRGRHYDQAAAFTTWLLEAQGGRHRAGTYALLAHVMEGRAAEGDFARLVGMSPEEAECAWLASLGH